jgi:hypothetical protein
MTDGRKARPAKGQGKRGRRRREVPDDPNDPYMSVSRAARELKISRATVLARAALGELAMERVAGLPVVTKESVAKAKQSKVA